MNRFIFPLLLAGLSLVLIGGLKYRNTQVQTAKDVKSAQLVQTPAPSLTVQTKELSSQGFVVRVIDGDTIDVQINGKEEKIRLIGINAPETNECFGKEATDRAKEILSSKSVNLELDSTQDDRDKYHRLLRYVFVDGANFDELMVREGFAKEYTYHTPYKYQSEFKSAQADAQNNKRGLWADNACSSSKTEQSPGPVQSSSSGGNFTCDCSKLCSQISTCDEAYFQLNNCGCTKRDSDHDGIPCESLCK